MTLPVLSVDLVRAALKSSGYLAKLSPEVLKEMETRYLKFLRLAQKYRDRPLAPPFDIDEMWHLHMLHPRAYFHDCMNLFGSILDHDGEFGKTEEERPLLRQYADETEKLWKEEYGEELITPLSVKLKQKFAPDQPGVVCKCVWVPEAKEQQSTCVVSPEAREQQSTCVVSPEAREQQSTCVVSPEAKEQQSTCVVSPEAREQQSTCVVSPEAKEQQSTCVVSPEVTEQQSTCVVSPEAKEQQSTCVVSPEAKEQ
jgi:hypothetical protein